MTYFNFNALWDNTNDHQLSLQCISFIGDLHSSESVLVWASNTTISGRMAQTAYFVQFVTLQIFLVLTRTLVYSATVEPVYPFAEVYLATESENLTLLSKDTNSEILILPEFIRSNKTKQFQNVVLVCNAAYPIEWMYSGDGVGSIFSV